MKSEDRDGCAIMIAYGIAAIVVTAIVFIFAIGVKYIIDVI